MEGFQISLSPTLEQFENLMQELFKKAYWEKYSDFDVGFSPH